MSDFTDISTITILDTIENMTILWTNYTIPLSSYSGSGKYVILGVPAGINEACEYWIDDLVIDYDTCYSPTNLTANNITDNTADVSWTIVGNEATWVLEYKAISDVNYTSVTCSVPYQQLTSLIPQTQYEVRVKAICNIGNESDYISANFTTDSAQVITYTITASAGDNGTISPSGTINIPQGGNQTFAISPDNGYNIQDVLVDNVSQGDTSSYTFSNVQENHTISVSFIAGIEDNILETDVLIFPNPANNVLNIKSGQPFERVKITNLLGQVLYNAKITKSDFSIDISSYNSGIYFIRLEGKQGMVAKKFVKK